MELKDYLHLYLGCEVEIETKRLTKSGAEKDTRKGTFVGFADYYRLESRIAFRAGRPEGRIDTFFLKPILRPLSDMTKEESNKIGLIAFNMIHGESCYMSSQFAYLLSKHFDLFGLIESGLAIDATTLKEVTNGK